MNPSGDHRARDAAALRIIGGFFALFSVLVFLGSFWESWSLRPHAIVVNVLAAFILFGVGIGMFLIGTGLRRR